MHTFNNNELKEFLRTLILTNEYIADDGIIKPVSFCIRGEAGIGKTTAVKEVTEELDYNLITESLACVEYVGDLIGYSTKMYILSNGTDSIEVTESEKSHYLNNGYIDTGNYCTKQVPKESLSNIPNRTVLFLDDFNRTNNTILNAIMELIYSHKLPGVKFPHYFTIILAANPDNGEYNALSVDAAFDGRKAEAMLIWDKNNWAERAEKVGLDERGINFVLLYPELFEDSKEEDLISNKNKIQPRQMDRFLVVLKYFKDLQENLTFIYNYGCCTIGEYATRLFINYVNNEMQNIPKISSLFTKKGVEILKQATNTVKDINYNSTIAALVTLRIINYCNSNVLTSEASTNLISLINSDCFSLDLKFIMLEKLAKGRLKNKLLNNLELNKIILTT